ncbi:hypothetical protein DYB32_004059 [Aphanomyces invadans]|uniref:F-box/LRR-repeat protein 15-like leucin rich repeat domain-containing protein n=1 Tax=Aphanomyces invadans TaxID=157072 RepID=A0A3R6VMX5_9STRA|nr:hypothetical protein DYB32_004059 [Aphanomyces invadans]
MKRGRVKTELGSVRAARAPPKPRHINNQAASNTCDAPDDIDAILIHQLPGTLDLRPHAAWVTDHVLVELAIAILQRKTTITHLRIAGCHAFSAVGMRSLVHAIGPHLKSLDYSASTVKRDVLKVLVTRLEDLRELDFSSCATLSSEILRDFMPCCNHTLEKCNLANCNLVNDEGNGRPTFILLDIPTHSWPSTAALCWLAGSLGVQGGLTQCANLKSLNLAHSTLVGDRGVAALGCGCAALQFVNLEGLINVTDAGMVKFVAGCRSLRVLHVKRCVQVHLFLAAIGAHCRHLRSINLCGCGRVTTDGMASLVRGASQLQAIDVQGCNLLTEEFLCVVATHLPALQLLNVNGCQQITDNGVRTLVEHLPYVMSATQFRGLEPVANAISLKFATHQKTISHSAAIRLQAWYRGHLGRVEAASWRRMQVEVPAANRLKHWFTMVQLVQEVNRRAAASSHARRSATMIQALARGFLVRARAYREADNLFRLNAMLQKERRKHAMDSASEADSEDDWYAYPGTNGQPWWFSPSRDVRQIVRPNCFAIAKAMVGLGVRVYWPFEDTWFEGRLVKFCTSKNKHKIEYLDGDKEWSVLNEVDIGHLQLFHHDCWLMYENYVASDRAKKAALYVNTRVQRYDVTTFAWKSGKVRWFDDSTGLFCVENDDNGEMEAVDMLGNEDDFQVQDRRSLEWMSPGAYFFGPAYAAMRVQDYFEYTGPMGAGWCIWRMGR